MAVWFLFEILMWYLAILTGFLSLAWQWREKGGGRDSECAVSGVTQLVEQQSL